MLRTAIITALLSIGAACAHADEWTQTQKTLAATTAVATIVDWGTTLDIAKNPDKWHEVNPTLGEHPSVSTVNRHFVRGAVLVAATACMLQGSYRTAFLGGYTLVEVGFAAHNLRIGLKVNF